MRTMLLSFVLRPSCLVVAVAMWALAAPALSQSLADVARKEGQRRKEQPKTGKVYTNDNLRRDFTVSTSPADGAVPAPTPGDAAPAPAPADSTEAPAAADPKKTEAYWQGRMSSAREQFERAQSFATALESQINALTVEFVNRDDPARRAVIETNRKKAVADYEKVLREVEGHKKAIAAVEDDARKAGVPPGWLR